MIRRTGIDLPGHDLRLPHGLPFEGWFWRLTEPRSQTVVVALLAVNRDAAGRSWGTAALAVHPGGGVWPAATPHAWADGLRCGASGAGLELDASPSHLRVVGDGARLDVRFADRQAWPLRLGGSGLGHLVPGLSQYWHPHTLGARVTGSLTVDGKSTDLDAAHLYAEKNWGAAGFPPAWWWGQAQAFDSDPEACVAFAGGRAGVGSLRTVATAVVVRAGDRVARLVRPVLPLRVGDQGWRIGARLPLGTLELEIEGHADGIAPHRLPVPLPAHGHNLEDGADQQLAGQLRVVVRRRRQTILDGVSSLAGLERGRPSGAVTQAELVRHDLEATRADIEGRPRPVVPGNLRRDVRSLGGSLAPGPDLADELVEERRHEARRDERA